MAKYSKFNIIYQLQKWMDSVAGQTFMNYAYSWGAAVVILGTLFKLTHLPGANVMLFIGMGTEVFVFFISAFDRPFDKTQDGRELATDTQLAAEAALAAGAPLAPAGGDVAVAVNDGVETPSNMGGVAAASSVSPVGGGTIIIGPGAIPAEGGGAPVAGNDGVETPSHFEGGAAMTAGGAVAMGSGGATVIAPTPAPAVTPETAQAMEEATTTYVDRLNELNELLLKVGAQSERLTTDSEEMENLNRTLTGIARIYEMQLKSASQQINTQDEINEQTRKMAKQIEELNSIYSRMIEAMKASNRE